MPITIKGQVVRVVCKRGNQLLFVQSSDRTDVWEFPGGKIKRNETAKMAAIRELHEETNLVAQTMQYISGWRRSIPHDETIVWDHFIFEAVGCDYSQLLIDHDEISDFCWLDDTTANRLPLELMTHAFLASGSYQRYTKERL